MAYTTINDPSAHFQTKIYTGDGTEDRNITNDGNTNLRPDWIWIKSRSSADRHVLLDSCRGATKNLTANNSNAEDTNNGMTAFQSNGFQVGGQDEGTSITNWNSFTYAAWQWAAGGAAPTQTYRVVVVSDGGNKYRFRNSANTATFAQSAVTLDLQEGGTYTFDVSDSSVSSHPFVIGTSANSNEYSTGVTYKLDGVTKTYSQYTSGFASATSRQLIITVAASAPTLYYWCSVHSGMGGQINTNTTFGSTNFDGSILTKASANTTAGFSIVTYTGNASAGATIGHGLGSTPAMVLVKTRSISFDWYVYHKDIGNTKYLELNTDNAKDTRSGAWNDTSPNSTVITLGSDDGANDDNTMVAYCFADIQGYSKFGSYTGNGATDGPFVYLGFKPAWLLYRNVDRTENWLIEDNKRNTFNRVAGAKLQANVSDAETNEQRWGFDFLSNGFKIRNNETGKNANNGDGETIIYMAFAEAPMVASNNVVGLAR